MVFGEFAGLHGLGRAAAYDLELVRTRHSAVTPVDIGPYLLGRPVGRSALRGPFDNAYFLCLPDKYARICLMLSPDALARAYRVGRWVWETPLFPSDWRFAERMVHEVWTPSEFCARCFAPRWRSPSASFPMLRRRPGKRDSISAPASTCPPPAFMGLAIMDINLMSRTQEPVGSCARLETCVRRRSRARSSS